MKIKPLLLSPSLLSSDFGNLERELLGLEEAGLEWVHWDIMDGQFVPNITFGPPVIKKLRPRSRLFFDVHLMIEQPQRYISQFVDAGANLVCVHAEACVHLERVVSQIKEAGAKCAVALNPATPLEALRYLLPQLDMVLLMSVNPGFGGQSFLPFVMDKIAELKKLVRAHSPQTLIQVDGGVHLQNAGAIIAAGADILVSGSAFFTGKPYSEMHTLFQQAMAKPCK